MRKILILFSIMSVIPGSARAQALDFYKNEKNIERKRSADIEEGECYQASFAAISDSILASWTRTFVQEGIDNNPFAMMIHLIDHFSRMDQVRHNNCISLESIYKEGQTNVRSSAITTCALMHKMGWDLQCFYDDVETYLGVCFSDDWGIVGGEGAERESDGRVYLWKDFDISSQVGKFRQVDVSRFKNTKQTDLAPFPLIKTLPWFEGEYFERQLRWQYQNKMHTFTVRIPKQQIEWTKNLPSSLYGMVASGILELKQTGLPDYLQQLVQGLSEYEKVNYLFKFCQSEGVFRYADQPIKSVSRQLQEACNDCDSRGVFLYCLLRTVMDYTDDDIVFVLWPDEQHLALSLRPRTEGALEILKKKGYCTHDDFYVLDPTYTGKTRWGSIAEDLPDRGEIITR